MSETSSPFSQSTFLGHSSYRSHVPGLNTFASEIEHLTNTSEWDFRPTDAESALFTHIGDVSISQQVALAPEDK